MNKEARSRIPGMARRVLLGGVATAAIAIGVTATASADEIIFWSNRDQDQIEKTDVTTGITTVIGSTPFRQGDPDSLIFDNSGNIIYSMVSPASGPFSVQIFSMNPATGASTGITTKPPGGNNFSTNLRDLALDPGGTSFLVSDLQTKKIRRVNLATGVRTDLHTFLSAPAGIAYDSLGHLFAAVDSQIVQLDPTTGSILNTVTVGQFIDGLTFDPVTSMLYGAEASCVVAVNPTNLTVGGCFGLGNFTNLDGIEADGQGNVVVADIGSFNPNVGGNTNAHVFQVDVAGSTHTVNKLFDANGIDDIAPIIGLGSQPTPTTSAPEPATLLLLATGLAGLAALRSRQRAVARVDRR